MRRDVLIGALVLGLAWSAQTGAALAAPGWTAASDYSLPANATPGAVHVGYQSGGTATVAYLELVSQTQSVMHVGIIPPGGGYQEQLRIPATPSLVPASVNLAEAPNGAAVVEWNAAQLPGPPYAFTYFASYRPAGSSSWEPPTTVYTEPSSSTGNITLVPAIAVNGTAAVGIDHSDPTLANGLRIDVAVHRPGGSWSPTAQISPTGPDLDSQQLQLGFDAGGDLTAAFRAKTTASYSLDSLTRPASTGIWSSIQQLVPPSVFSPTLGVGPDGSAVLAWQGSSDVQAVTRSGATGAWSSVAHLTTTGTGNQPEAAAVSPSDKAYVAYQYQGHSSGEECAAMARAPLGGTFTAAPECVSPANFGSNVRFGGIAFVGNDAYFAWSGQPNGGTQYVVQGSRWLDGASAPDTFTNVEQPGSGFQFGEVLGDDDGSVAAFWLSGSPLTGSLRATAFDAGGPSLVAASVPGSAVAGQPVSMSANYADLWSGISGSPSWSFGDGTTSSGGQVSHTYAEPGTYTVTINADDVLGNQTTSTYTITVTPPSSTTAPKLGKVHQSAKKWRERASKHRRHGKPVPVGTRFSFTLDQPATVRLAFAKPAPGRRVSSKCVPQTKRNSRKQRCTLSKPVGQLVLTGHAASNQLAFKGLIPGRGRLAPGTYSVTVSATNSAGQTSRASRLTFTIVAR